MKTIYLKRLAPDQSSKPTLHYEIVEHNEKKFLIYIEGNGSTPLGFNKDCCIKVMNDNGSWDNIVDNRQIGLTFKKDNLYYSSNAIAKNNILDALVKEFKDYIRIVY